MIIGPKITSKTYVLKTAKSMKYVLFRRAWVGFLALCLVLSPIAGILWNPQNNTAFANTVVYGFAKQMGGTGVDTGKSIAIDDDGNIYSTGHFSGTADFDPGAGTANLTSAGGTDAYISKLDADGDFVWAKSMGGTDAELSNAIAVDASGNVYITGQFGGTADFDPGAGTANLVAGLFNDIYIAKLDTDGNYVWAKSFAGAGNGFYDKGLAIALDGDNNVYSTGTFDGTADFDPGAGTANLSSTNGLGSRDLYISKLDVDGNYVWAKSIGGSSDPDIGYGIALDDDDNVYTTGQFRSTVDFDPGAGTVNLISSGNSDIFVSKLDSAGDYVWAKNMGGTGADSGIRIIIDSDGYVYTTGGFAGTADFDPGAGTSNLVSAGSADAFVSKLDSAGDFVWAKATSGTDFNYGRGIDLDSSDNVYITGNYGATADFDPGAGTSNLTSAGGYDVFVAKLDPDGDFGFAKSFGSTGNDYGYGIALDSSDNIYTTGDFTGTADFDPGSGTSNLVSAGSNEIFVSKLSPQGDPTVTASSPSLITTSSATLNGNITDLGGPENSATRGFEYGLTDSYGTTVTQSEGSYSTGAFTAEITGLTCGTNYYFRAFATNSSGTGYSAGTSFPTSSCSATGTNTKSVTPTNPTPNIDLLSPITPVTPETPNLVNNPSNPTNRVGLPLLPPTERFLRNLGFGSTGEDVKRLQQFLNTNDYMVSTLGAGSINQETNFFGPRTKQAVKVFQEHFSAQILAPLSLSSGTGYFGDSTRAFVNGLLP